MPEEPMAAVTSVIVDIVNNNFIIIVVIGIINKH